MAPPPVVTGISPKEGPPGTRVIVRGEFLGVRAQELIGLTICGCDCTLSAEWKSQNKIIARSGPCKGRGDIIVTTRNGGQGTSTVQFRGYHETIGPMKESAVWVEEAPMQSFVWGRGALSPINYQQEDPLGLSVEGNDKKFPEDDLAELFGDGSGELTNDKFHPGWFLLQNHHATNLDDLKAGLAYLRRKVNSQKEGQLSFLKANVGSVMEQLETIMFLKEQFEADIKKYGENPMEKLEGAIQESMTEANKLFDDVLARRDRADATRNALSVMQRYRFLFCMPVNIDKNIKHGNYDLVINDYARVKNLFKNTEVEIFKKVLAEIENRIERLRVILRKKLEETPYTLEEQKKIIRNLISLEAEGDPAWNAIVSHASHLEKSTKACVHEFLEMELASGDDPSKTGKSNASSRQPRSFQNDKNTVPLRVQCVEAICDVVTDQVPDLWRLGQSYFTGQLHLTVDVDKQGPFKNLVLGSIRHAVDAMRNSCSSNIEASWLLHNLRCVRQMYASLIHLDLPSDALDIFGSFIFDLRLQCLMALFKQAADNVLALHRKENWQIEYLEEDGRVTKLPCLFEQIVMDVATTARETAVACGPRETPLFASPSQQLQYFSVVKALFTTFTRCLRQLAFSGSEEALDVEVSAVSQLITSPAGYRVKESKQQGPTWEQCLLISLSNIRYTLRVIVTRIDGNLKAIGYPEFSSAGWTSDWTQLETLDSAVLDAYLERRCDPLVGTIEPSMYLGDLEWDTDVSPTHIRPYAQEAMANLIAVHAEVRRVSPSLLKRVLSHIVETIAEELARLMSCVKRFSPSGVIQARADISFLQKALEVYSTQRARSFFEEALEAIPLAKSKEDASRINILLSKVMTSMKLQLNCLVNHSADVKVQNATFERLTII